MTSPPRSTVTAPVASVPPELHGRLRVLHLGFEDPLMPGAGGGSVRTHQINRRLAAGGFSVTVLTTTYPGAEERIQDGVRYVPVGFGQGRNRLTRLLGYIARLPFEARRRRGEADLVVEDFFAPFSSMAAPLWSGRPTIGVVQWLHAGDKARQYKVPVHWLERFGVRSHSRMIAVSQGTADKLALLNPAARVEVVGNGIDRNSLDREPELGDNVLFVGRLELKPKGIDLLLSAWAAAAPQLGAKLILAGTGPDHERIEQLINSLGLSESVELVGWVSGEAKRDLVRSARLVVVPSRHETFGLVAVEALAGGTPAIIFDIPGLREVVPRDCGWMVRPFDVQALAAELVQRYPDGSTLLAAGRRGQAFARQFDWDVQADRQAAIYRSALSARTGG
ncbi:MULTISPECIES: glycosyltransferase family 4 protein [unclassified Arthrobacter]|uniref:glycosyltransferase family 4 protein n=1 Tax=unclassified Arthrobacter TaxID=235627 RepID=UPI001E34A5CE|nr:MULTISPECIES: glycosyltransferase family 4 protein [unclassified Arthrobacter]MCC9144278.1 glycosyltransferase family 4 protein [Arthrobacter sp. zg-Y919]MDK1275503.1 glycosyltransferase family 4 protein [Arthrobacter sp. zg.Y919]WIB03122.1 glycosyltransferase family 4 protein [Arthrobacter sp. zg-Y919]